MVETAKTEQSLEAIIGQPVPTSPYMYRSSIILKSPLHILSLQRQRSFHRETTLICVDCVQSFCIGLRKRFNTNLLGPLRNIDSISSLFLHITPRDLLRHLLKPVSDILPRHTHPLTLSSLSLLPHPFEKTSLPFFDVSLIPYHLTKDLVLHVRASFFNLLPFSHLNSQHLSASPCTPYLTWGLHLTQVSYTGSLSTGLGC